MDRLPDEILKEILEPSLHIPDDEFSSIGRARESPFGRTARNSSSLLIVSKRWMRVATPLLYEVVIIRSTAQAQALAYAIKSNKAFGLFIKKIRMEGGFGKAPAQFIASAPNIRDIFLTLDLWSSDNPAGLCSVFSGMNPRRLIMNHQDAAIRNAKAIQLWNSISTCIYHWPNLEILEYHSSFFIAMNGRGKYMELVAILKASPNVKHIVLHEITLPVLTELALVTSLETISVESLSLPQRKFIASNTRLLKVVQVRKKVPDQPMPHVLPIASVIAGFKPLDNVLWHIAKHIWDLIFSFATHSYYLEKPPSVKPLSAPYFSPSRALLYASARSLSLVSKSFREIVRRHLFSIVQIENSRRFLAFSHAINDNDTVGQLVRIFRVNFLRSSLGAAYDNRMTQILPALTGLVYLDAPLIDLRPLKLLNPAAIVNLQSLDVRLAVCSQPEHDTVELGVLGGLAYFRCRFDQFAALRQTTPLRLPPLIVDLPNLTSFSMGVKEKEDTLDAFCNVRMQSLTHLQLCGQHPKTEEFLRLNGGMLQVLEIFEVPPSSLWTWCPHLEHLMVWYNPVSLFKSLRRGQGHSSLSKLYFTFRGSNTEKKMLSATEGFEFVDFSQFPCLREVHIRGLIWPNTERDIKKNPRCDSFALCLKKWGIVVYDGSGTPWRERAQIRRGR